MSSTEGNVPDGDETFALVWIYNTGHAFLYGILALLCVANLPRRGSWVVLTLPRSLLILVLVMAYGIVDEWHQSWVPARSASPWDLVTDLVGAGATLAVIAGLGARSPQDRSDWVRHLRSTLWLGFVLSWIAGLAATILDS